MKENLLERINKDKIANNHGKKIIELCKLSDLKIANGRIGTDKSIGSYTCHTPRGSSTLDYAILSMGLFPYIVDFYIDMYDKCLSDVHCPVCIVMSGKKCSTIENNIGLVTHNEYLKTKHVKIAWKQELSNQYTHSFNVKEIEQFQSKLTHIMSEMDHVTQHIIDTLYTDMKTILIYPAKVTDMYKQYTLNSSYHNKRTRRHGKKHGLMMNVRYYARNVC